MADLATERPAPIVVAGESPVTGEEAQGQLSPTTPVYRRGYYDFEDEDHDHHHDDHDQHHEKKSVLAKVKDKAKKWRHLLAKKRHGHHDHENESSSPNSCDGSFNDVDDEDQEQDPEYHGAPMYESEMAPNAYRRAALKHQAATQSPRSVATHQTSRWNEESALQQGTDGYEEPALINLDPFRESSDHRIMTNSPPSSNKHLLQANTKQEGSVKGNMASHSSSFGTNLLTDNLIHEEHIQKINSNNADYPAFSELQLLMANAIHEDTIKGRGGHTNHDALSDSHNRTAYAKHLAISGTHPTTPNAKHENPFEDPGSSREDYPEFFDAVVSESQIKPEYTIKESGRSMTNNAATINSQIQLLMANNEHEVGSSKGSHHVISDRHLYIGNAKHSDPIKESGSINKAHHHALSDTHLLMNKAKLADTIKQSNSSKAGVPAVTIEDLLRHDEEPMKETVGNIITHPVSPSTRSTKTEERYEDQMKEIGSTKTINHTASSNKRLMGGNAKHEDHTKESYNRQTEHLPFADKNLNLEGPNMKQEDLTKKSHKDDVNSPASSDVHLLMEKLKHEELHGFGNNQINRPTSPNKNFVGANTKDEDPRMESYNKAEHVSFSDKNLMGSNMKQEDAKKSQKDRVNSPTSSDTHILMAKARHEELKGYGNNQMNHPTSPNKNILRANKKDEDPTTESYNSKTGNLPFSDKDLGGVSMRREESKKSHQDRVSSPASSDTHLFMAKVKHEELHGYGNNQMNHPTSPMENNLRANTEYGEPIVKSHNNKTEHLSIADKNLVRFNMNQEDFSKNSQKDGVYSPTSCDTHLLMTKMKHKELHGFGNNHMNHPASPNKNILRANTEYEEPATKSYNSQTEHLSFLDKNQTGINTKQEEPTKKSHIYRVNSPTSSDPLLLRAEMKHKEHHGYDNNHMNHPTSPIKNILRDNKEYEEPIVKGHNSKTEHLSIADKNPMGLNTNQEDLGKKSQKGGVNSPTSCDTHLLMAKVKHEELHGFGNNQMNHPTSRNKNILRDKREYEEPTTKTYNSNREHFSFLNKNMMGINMKQEEHTKKSHKDRVNSPTSSEPHLLRAEVKHEELHAYGNKQVNHPASPNKNILRATTEYEESAINNYSSKTDHLTLLDKNLTGINMKQENTAEKSHKSREDSPTSSETHLLMTKVNHEKLHGHGNNNQIDHSTSPGKIMLSANAKYEEPTTESYNSKTEHLSFSDKNVGGLNTKQEEPTQKSHNDRVNSPTSSETHRLMTKVKHEKLHGYGNNNKMNHSTSPSKNILSTNTKYEEPTTESYNSKTEHISFSDKNVRGFNTSQEEPTKKSHINRMNSPTSSGTHLLMEKVKQEELHGYGSNQMNRPTSPNKNIMRANAKDDDPRPKSYDSKIEHLSYSDKNLRELNTKQEELTKKSHKDRMNSPTSSDTHLLTAKMKHEGLYEYGNNQVNHPTSPNMNILKANTEYEKPTMDNYNNKTENLTFLDNNLIGFNTNQEDTEKKSHTSRVDSPTSSDTHLLMAKMKHEELHGYGNNQSTHPTSPGNNVLGRKTRHEDPTMESYDRKTEHLSFSDKNLTGFNMKQEDYATNWHNDKVNSPSSDTHLLMDKAKYEDLHEYGNNKKDHPASPNKGLFGANTKCEEPIKERSNNGATNPAFAKSDRLEVSAMGEDINIADHHTTFENLLMAKAKHEDPIKERIQNKVSRLELSDTERLIAKAYPGEPIKEGVSKKENYPIVNNGILVANAEQETHNRKHIDQQANISKSANQHCFTANSKQKDPIREIGLSDANHPAISDTQVMLKGKQGNSVMGSGTSQVNHRSNSDKSLLMGRTKQEATLTQDSSEHANHPTFFDGRISTTNTKPEELVEEHRITKTLTKTVSEILAPAYAMVSDTSHTIALKILCPTDGDEIGALEAHDPVKELTDTVSEVLSPAYTMVSDTSRKIASQIQSPRARNEIESELVPESFKEMARDRTITETMSNMFKPAYTAVSDASHMIASKIHGQTTRDEIRGEMAPEPIKKSNSRKKLTETVSKMLAPTYNKMSDASHKIATKIQGQTGGDETEAKQVGYAGLSAPEVQGPTARDEIGEKMVHKSNNEKTSNTRLNETVSDMVAPTATKIKAQAGGEETGTEQVWDKRMPASMIDGQTDREEREVNMVHDPLRKNNIHKTLTETDSKMPAQTSATMPDTPDIIATKTKGQKVGSETGAMQVWDKGVTASKIQGPTTKDERTAKMALDPITKKVSSKTMTETVSEMFAPAYTMMSDASHKIVTKIKGQAGGDETGSKQVWDKEMQDSKMQGQTTREETEAKMAHDPIRKNNSHKTLTETVSEMPAPTYTIVSEAPRMVATEISKGEGGGYETGTMQARDTGVTASKIQGPTPRVEIAAKMALDPITKSSNSYKTMTETVSDMLTPTYTMASDASQKIATKIKGQADVVETSANQVWDKGVSVKEYLTHKLEPGEEDKALSQVITDAVSSTKTALVEAENAGVVEKLRMAVYSLLRKKEHPVNKENPVTITRVSSLLVMGKHTEATNLVSSVTVKEEYTGPILPVSTHPHTVEITEKNGKGLQAYAN